MISYGNFNILNILYVCVYIYIYTYTIKFLQINSIKLVKLLYMKIIHFFFVSANSAVHSRNIDF